MGRTKVEIDIDTDALLEKSVKSQLLEGAVAHIIKELTPERLKLFVEGLLEEALKGLSKWDIQKRLEEKSKEYITKYLKENEDDINTRIQAAVKAGIEEALAQTKDNVRDQLAKDIPMIIEQRVNGRYPNR